jgi:transmembrane sensor
MSDDLRPASSPLDREAYEWMMRFAGGQASPAELAALKRWSARSPAHAEAFDRVSRTWSALGPVGQKLASEGRLSGLPRLERMAAVARPSIARRAFLGSALAASVAGAGILMARPPLDLWPSWPELAADYRTEAGEQRQIALSDHVEVDMNTRTSIAVRAAAAEAQLIAGEAMVSAPVGSGTAFTLRAADGRIVAADARFNVRIEGQAVCVTCIAGEVRVEQRGAILPLPAGQQVFYTDQGIGRPVVVDPAMVTAWQNGVVIFQLTPITEVIAEVNRYRPGRIILTNEALGRRLFNARLRIAHIDRVVPQIEQTFGARARELPGGIMLLG